MLLSSNCRATDFSWRAFVCCVPIRASCANLWRTSGGRNGNRDGITSRHEFPRPAVASPPHLQVACEITFVASETYFTIAQSPRFVGCAMLLAQPLLSSEFTATIPWQTSRAKPVGTSRTLADNVFKHTSACSLRGGPALMLPLASKSLSLQTIFRRKG